MASLETIFAFIVETILDSFAPCPTEKHLKDGIVFISNLKNGTSLKRGVRDMGDGIVWASTLHPFFEGTYQNYYDNGVFELYSGNTLKKYEKRVTYDQEVSAVFPLETGKTLHFTHGFQNEERNLRWDWTSDLTVGERGTVRIGGCSYETLLLRVEGTYSRSDGVAKTTVQNYTYLPKLHYAASHGFSAKVPYDRVRPMRVRDKFVIEPMPDHVTAYVAKTKKVLE